MVRGLLSSLVLGLLLSAGGYGQDFEITSSVTGPVTINLGSGGLVYHVRCSTTENYYDYTTGQDSLAGFKVFVVHRRGNAMLRPDTMMTFEPMPPNLLDPNYGLKASLTGDIEPLPLDGMATAFFHRSVSGPGISGEIDDTLYSNGDNYDHFITGEESLPAGGVDIDLTAAAIIKRHSVSHFLLDGTMFGETTLLADTPGKGTVEATITVTGTFTAADSRVPLPMTIEATDSLISYDTLTGEWESEGEVVAGPYRGDQVPTLNRWGLIGLLGVMVLSAAVVLVRRRRVAS